MGGRGSGKRATFGLYADLCHRSHSIDMAWLNKRKLLQAGKWTTLSWSVRGEQTGSIQICLVPEGLTLSYRTRHRGGDWRDVKEVVPIVETGTNFSGRRSWFACLTCGRRCRILYGGTYFRCRHCTGLRYETQYEPAFARAATRALKIRERLGDSGGIDDPFPERPKGMHQRTYERLRAEAESFEERWDHAISGFVHDIGRRG